MRSTTTSFLVDRNRDCYAVTSEGKAILLQYGHPLFVRRIIRTLQYERVDLCRENQSVRVERDGYRPPDTALIHTKSLGESRHLHSAVCASERSFCTPNQACGIE